MFRDCDFIGNAGYDEGMMHIPAGASARFQRCRFIANSAYSGGAIQVESNPTPATIEVVNCFFMDNTAAFAGAISNGGFAKVHNSLFLGNNTNFNNGYNAGAISTGAAGHLQVTNCLLSGNFAGYLGAVMTLNGDATIRSCTIVNNREHLGPSGALHHFDGNVTVANSILWGNTSGGALPIERQQIYTESVPSITINHSIVQGWTGLLGGAGNSGADPLFVDADGPDDLYGTADDNPRLSAFSPARDTGDNAALPLDTFDLDGDGNMSEPIPFDLDFRRRVANDIVDRGAFELQTCLADIAPVATQGDGAIDVNDLLLMISSWGQCDIPCAADIAPVNSPGDGSVDVNDLLLLIGGWGSCP